MRWSAFSGATNYFVKRATSPGGPCTFTNSLAGNSYTNTGLTNGVTYYYVVSAATLPALPGSWDFGDAGFPNTPGNLTYTNGTFTVKGRAQTLADFTTPTRSASRMST